MRRGSIVRTSGLRTSFDRTPRPGGGGASVTMVPDVYSPESFVAP